MLVEPNPRISISRQCELLGLSRSQYYYTSQISKYNEQLMMLIDRRYTLYPWEGYRRIAEWLNTQGYKVSHDKVRYLMRDMGIQAIYPKPNTSIKARDEHTVYPYLLNNVCVYYPNQVWCADITYIKLNIGHIYLVAIMYWYSRYVISWRLSNSLETEFCIAALEEALEKQVCGIFNTDQGAQFTSKIWTNKLLNNGVTISMDAVGRCFDNIFVERLWRSVKYECIFMQELSSIKDNQAKLIEYFEYYNKDRLHQNLNYNTPEKVYYGKVKLENKFGI